MGKAAVLVLEDLPITDKMESKHSKLEKLTLNCLISKTQKRCPQRLEVLSLRRGIN